MEEIKIWHVMDEGFNNGKDSFDLAVGGYEIYNKELGEYLDGLFKGEKVEKWDNRNKIYYDQEGYHAPINFGLYMDPLLDKEFKEKLEKEFKLEERGLVQYLKVPVVDIKYRKEVEGLPEEEIKKKGIPYYEYWIMNVLNMLPHEVIDDERSNYDDKWIYAIFVFCKDRLLNYKDRLDIFRVDERFGKGSISLFTNEEMKRFIQKEDRRRLKEYIEKNKDKLRVKKKRYQKDTYEWEKIELTEECKEGLLEKVKKMFK